MTCDVAIVGVGKTSFGRHEDSTGLRLGVEAARAALQDAGLQWADVQVAVGGSMSAGNADASVSALGLTGLPFINVFNGCATGGSALTTASAMITSGEADVALAVGFDKHPRGAFDLDPQDWGLGEWYGHNGLMVAPQYFAMKIRRYMHDHGITDRSLALVAAKAFRNGSLTPTAWRRTALSADDVAAAPVVCPPLTQFMFCAPGAGAAAVVLASRERAKTITKLPIWLRSVAQRTRQFGAFTVFSPSLPIQSGVETTTDAARAAFAQAGIGPGDVQVVQIQDTESGAEIIHLAEAGLCEHGEQERLLHDGETDIGGRLPVNTDGGCIANGEPVGASGLRQIHEITLQLRGDAGPRQVPGNPAVGFTHVYGAPGVSACAVLSR
ncbi:thiolase family protein [Mycobacterium sp.]|uniref:thiolase family protein n=1 Tax=Mycobacterium sp. TaxID=1785 RepID=UPI00120E5916|nr:thiolase family protein [Mycobacterium sp.]TAM69788.1 MAG: thiolase family protein [Mycobacterium sp.]